MEGGKCFFFLQIEMDKLKQVEIFLIYFFFISGSEKSMGEITVG